VHRRRGISTRGRLSLLAPVAAAFAAGCGGGSARAPAQAPSPAAATPASAASVRVARSKLGRILVDAHGMTLYLFTEDRRGRSHCYYACARLWVPASVSGRPTPGAGMTARLTTVRRHDHSRQLVYNGHPLYTLVADERPGQINGQGSSGTWFVVSPAGRQIGHGRPAGYD
jgi:predicted lipoprotein with Yx(FWY)xxD motif